MAHSVDSTPQNAAAALRTGLDLLERRAVKPDATYVEDFLLQLDDLDRRFDALEAEGMDLRPERVRWENVLRRLDSQPTLIARPAARAGGLKALRAAHPPAESFWWHADEAVARRRRQILTQIGAILLVAFALAAAVYVVMTWVFPPDPQAVAVLEATTAVERAIQNQEWDRAVEIARAQAAQMPDNAELAMWAAVLSERAGLAVPAEVQATTEALLKSDPLGYWLQRGEVGLRLDTMQVSLDAAKEAIALNPDSPEAHFLWGRAALLANDRAAALEHLDLAARLAEADNPRLSVSARMVWADLVQRPEFPTAIPTP